MITVLDYQLADNALNQKIKAIVESLQVLANRSATAAAKEMACKCLIEMQDEINTLNSKELSVGIMLGSHNLHVEAAYYQQYQGQHLYIAIGAAFGNHVQLAETYIAHMGGDLKANLNCIAAYAARGGNISYADELIDRIQRQGYGIKADLNLIAANAAQGGNNSYANALIARMERQDSGIKANLNAIAAYAARGGNISYANELIERMERQDSGTKVNLEYIADAAERGGDLQYAEQLRKKASCLEAREMAIAVALAAATPVPALVVFGSAPAPISLNIQLRTQQQQLQIQQQQIGFLAEQVRRLTAIANPALLATAQSGADALPALERTHPTITAPTAVVVVKPEPQDGIGAAAASNTVGSAAMAAIPVGNRLDALINVAAGSNPRLPIVLDNSGSALAASAVQTCDNAKAVAEPAKPKARNKT